MQRWVQRRVESGLYEDVSDYVRDLIRRDQTGAAFEMGLLRFQALIDAGIADLDAGRVFEADAVFDEMEAAISEIERKKSA
ncbi:hypothetical protein ASG43_12735 [Aureimonas sp. Leaf454]|nr:hypothetical protein ASG43_12735 [Aureimonas sp. Leaf454]